MMLIHVGRRMIFMVVVFLRSGKKAEADCSGYDHGFYQ
tara:strand:- start:857 stop:970 length:114 start_codon:yes stop_codon:yes gene_type:complete